MVATNKTQNAVADQAVTGLTAQEMKETIEDMYMHGYRYSMLELGGVGIGKSVAVREAVENIAKNLGKTFFEYSAGKEVPENAFLFVDLRLTEIEPTDIGGVPRDAPDGKTLLMKPLRYVELLSRLPGVLFLDEITNETRPNMKAACYKILNERRMGDYKMHKDVLIIAAGNRPEEATGLAEAMPYPMASRLTIYSMRPPTIDEWIQYMDEHVLSKQVDEKSKKEVQKEDWDRKVIAYLKKYPGHLYILPSEAQVLDNFPTPRSWEIVARFSHKIDKRRIESLATGRLGKEVGNMFIQFLNTQVKPLEYFLENNERWSELQDEVSAKYLVAVEIADKWAADTRATGGIDQLCNYISKNDRETLAVLFSIIRQTDKNEVVRRLLKKDKTIIDFLKKLAVYKFNKDVDE